jgi:hypothetical protein
LVISDFDFRNSDFPAKCLVPASPGWGKVPTTAGRGLWTLLSAHAFTGKFKALAFEKYLKSGSVREFARRHF